MSSLATRTKDLVLASVLHLQREAAIQVVLIVPALSSHCGCADRWCWMTVTAMMSKMPPVSIYLRSESSS